MTKLQMRFEVGDRNAAQENLKIRRGDGDCIGQGGQGRKCVVDDPTHPGQQPCGGKTQGKSKPHDRFGQSRSRSGCGQSSFTDFDDQKAGGNKRGEMGDSDRTVEAHSMDPLHRNATHHQSQKRPEDRPQDADMAMVDNLV